MLNTIFQLNIKRRSKKREKKQLWKFSNQLNCCCRSLHSFAILFCRFWFRRSPQFLRPHFFSPLHLSLLRRACISMANNSFLLTTRWFILWSRKRRAIKLYQEKPIEMNLFYLAFARITYFFSAWCSVVWRMWSEMRTRKEEKLLKISFEIRQLFCGLRFNGFFVLFLRLFLGGKILLWVEIAAEWVMRVFYEA